MRKAKKSKTKKQMDTRTTACDHCDKRHYVMDGGWVVNGLGQVLCYSERRNCFDEVRKLREAARKGTEGFKLSLDD